VSKIAHKVTSEMGHGSVIKNDIPPFTLWHCQVVILNRWDL